MVSAPVKSAPVNEPKNVGTPGAQVRMIAPKKSGTIIMPPGMRSIVRLMGSCTMAASRALPRTRRPRLRDMLLLDVQLYKPVWFHWRRLLRGGEHSQEQALHPPDRLPARRQPRGSTGLWPGAPRAPRVRPRA